MSVIHLSIISAFFLTGAEPDSPVSISAPITQVNIPALVEERSPVQIEVLATFPTSCYSFGPTSVRLDRDRNVILFHASAYENHPDCEKSQAPTAEIVNLGVLREGTYEIRELKSLKKWGKIQVQHFDTSASISGSSLEATITSR